ncbi:UDP-N-acetylglucosamine 1-carboxyvinyltransferase [Hazenella coriacea]|uniref:UDP-N-acetylglucosamine 1-carboxyvinyltransferase n=1 Tax=Hazenella coriacea TaxID=1179467 RepID=A0A4R3L8S5_9BACL|nr:UDP-N-acetylglucosamine 1-carboxyvinyltransferase [Hazenella coriacea]TCS94624.1 UDP-N-acetylglucosamine 1-carboxyvinyltransferase [Hazenella coriacea]
MEHFVIDGGNPLTGSVRVQGAKNAALPIMAATVLAEGVHEIRGVPQLTDIAAMCNILEALGAVIERTHTTIRIDTTSIQHSHIPDDLMSQMRSSIFLMGPILARLKQVSVTRPGGCAIGSRPIDIHLKGLSQLGAEIKEKKEKIHCSGSRLIGASILLAFPSVGATENVMMAAVLAEGKTTILNAAREPEIVDLQNFLNQMGANVQGAGTSVIQIIGVNQLQAAKHEIIPDRIVAGTLIAAVGATSGELFLERVIPEHFTQVIDLYREAGIEIKVEHEGLWVRSSDRVNGLAHIETNPYPGFPTDLQPQMIALLSISKGISQLSEKIFESRLKHVQELNRMGANIDSQNNLVTIRGVSYLQGTHVEATDLRAGAALVIAGLAAKGTTVVRGVNHIDRGYDHLEKTFQQLGATIHREKV